MATGKVRALPVGIGLAAVDFYAELEISNTREWWASNKGRYATDVKAPMEALLAALEPEFGPGKVYRPHRDVRFSEDKRPLKDHQGGLVATAIMGGYYVQVGADGLMVAGGCYAMRPDQLARYREAVDDDPGEALDSLLTVLENGGWTIGGDQLKTRPKGFDADHPRLALLRRKSLTASKHYGIPAWLADDTSSHVAQDWRDLRSLMVWLESHVGETTESRERR
ncbi:MAG TPA: TIGR02453 family protein [Propionibacteriaceae bacterium]|nr:DUF2461 domain-containing protein [Micropruina sp.]HBX79810.1 TIGR02453 family protein [Propionibacteriaceae bacterium]HBY22277.1 TIGR02453 family protein [Propionibacteriaceae bacterium]